MTRPVPAMKVATLWKGAKSTWYQRRSAAYYSIAKKLVSDHYPRWLQDANLDTLTEDDGVEVYGDVWARVDGVRDWRARREKMLKLFWTFSNGWDEPSSYFNVEKFQRFTKRVARFLMFVDERAQLERDRARHG